MFQKYSRFEEENTISSFQFLNGEAVNLEKWIYTFVCGLALYTHLSLQFIWQGDVKQHTFEGTSDKHTHAWGF